MKSTVAAAAVAVVILWLGADVARAVTSADRRCRSAVQENTSKLARTVLKAMDACLLRERLSISPDTDCNTLNAADARGKITKATAKTTTGILDECSSLPPSYGNCPSPADEEDAGGMTTGVDDVVELADCEVAIHTETIVTLRNYVLRPRASAILAHPRAGDLKKCAKAIAKGSTKLWYTLARQLSTCQGDHQGPNDTNAYVCAGYSDAEIEKIDAKVKARISRYCSDLDADQMALLGTCSTDPQAARECVSTAVRQSAGGATATAYEFAGVCPAKLELVLRGGGRNGERNSDTSLELGWSGLGHENDALDGFTARFDVACANDDCASCAVTPSCDGGNCRCAHDSSIECTNPFVVGPPCGPNACALHFSPPLPVSAGQGPICVVTTVSAPVTGAADVGRGMMAIPVTARSGVHAGISQPRPCPACDGDTIFDDGLRHGTCQGGARDGLPCDADAASTTYGATSYDCPPTVGSNISGAGLRVDLTLTTGTVSLPFALPCDSPFDGFDCACSVCTLDDFVGCNGDADCVAVGAGSCRVDGLHGGVARAANGCDGMACVADPDPGAAPGAGICSTGPTDTFCDGIVATDGDGYIPCSAHAECSAITPPAGSCSLQKQRRCFLDPISATGVAGMDGAELVSTVCLPPTTSGVVNAGFGLPGPGSARLDVDLTTYCPAPKNTTQFELGGSSCN